MKAGAFTRWGRIGLVAALALVIALAAGLGGASAKKKAPKSKPFAASKTVNAPILDAVANQRSVPVTSTITVPKKYKGKVVGDVNVTGIKTTGTGAAAAANLTATLIAPNGRSVVLFRGQGSTSLGPWTLDDDSPVSICNQATPTCPNPSQSLPQPFAGTSNLVFNDGPSLPGLQVLNGVAMKGTWTLSVSDTVPATGTSVLNAWGLKITPAKPVTG